MSVTHGAVAAGSRYTAQAGIEVLREGGNAVDAVVAACLGTAAGEPALTSLAGGGVLLFYDAKQDSVSFCDFFTNGPGLGRPPGRGMEFLPVELWFGPAKQVFHIGRGAAAVPGVLQGLFSSLERWGRLPLKEVVKPACGMLRQGTVLDEYQAGCFTLLERILTHSREVEAIFAPEGKMLEAGSLFRNPDLADTLEAMANGDWRGFYEHELIPAILERFGVDEGGLITRRDLENYQVEFLAPLCRSYRGHRAYMSPPPAAGGTLIGLSLALLEGGDLLAEGWGGPGHLKALLNAMRVVEASRLEEGSPIEEASLERWQDRFGQLMKGGGTPLPALPEQGGGSTTHISVIDGEGNCAAVTLTYGEGNGYILGNTGIIMNNMMGEEDLHPQGFHQAPPGKRLSTMMSPTLLRAPDGGITILGTGGANRIRTAILQVLINLIDFAMSPEEAVCACRLHWDNRVLNAEVFGLPRGRGLLKDLLLQGEELVAFDRRDMFFGGVHLVRRTAGGELSGSGDPRRSGTCLVI